MAFYKAAEENPTILNEALAFTQEIRTLSLEQTIAPKNRLVVGQLYTVNDLLSRMIIDSDNEATSLLIANTDQAFLDRVFKDLHLPIRRNNQQETILSPEILSTFFRVLYNASYLNRPFSNEALSLLAKADFTQGIQAGVPTDIQVAHKFGERIYTNAQNHSLLTELHDCGIVYHPTNPYFLCIMTKGASVETQKKTIQNLSSLVYQKMDTFWKEEAQNRSSSQ
jgi:beta-lactamase class A